MFIGLYLYALISTYTFLSRCLKSPGKYT